MRRKIDKYLANWKENRKESLIVYGARQIGKSYSIEKFIKNNFQNYLIIDFSKMPDSIEMFEYFTSNDDFYNRLSFYGIKDKEDCVIFFDEIQELYRYRDEAKESDHNRYNGTIDLITITKSLVQDGKYRYIFSGSMLGVTLNSIALNPNGYMDTYRMFPMDFEEFLWANSIDDSFIDILKSNYENKEAVTTPIHNRMNKLFLEYILIGGMPKAVKEYTTTKDFQNVSIIQEGIINFYKADIMKYSKISDRLILSEIYNTLASEVNNINKRFIKTHININNIKNMDLLDKYLWLTESGIAIPVYNSNEPKYPLKINEDRKVLKLFCNDTGLLSYQLFGTLGRIKFLNGEINVNFGANFENVVAQELLAHGFKDLYYYNSKKVGEVDFIIEQYTKIIPIEIKSGKSNELNRFNHKALDNILSIYDNLEKPIIFSKENLSVDDASINMPIYMIMFLNRD